MSEYKTNHEVMKVVKTIFDSAKLINDKYKKYESDCEHLKAKGYKPETFFYAIGGGEDESDETIFVKDGKYLWWDYSTDTWYTGDNSNRNYVNGGDPSEVKVNIHSL